MKDEALKLALEALETELAVDMTNGAEVGEAAELMCEAITAIKQALAAPESEPVQATMKLESSGPGYGPAPKQKLSVRHVSLIDEGKTSAQPAPVQGPYSAPVKEMWPAVPDAIGPNEDELPAYAAGWNDCRQAMLEMMK